MIFERTISNLKSLVVGKETRLLARTALGLGTNLARGRVEISEAAINEGLKASIKNSGWLSHAEIECRDQHFWFELKLKRPVSAALGVPLKIREIRLTRSEKKIIFERISDIDIHLEDSLQRGLAQLGGRLIENVIGFDPVGFTLERLSFVKAEERVYIIDLDAVPEFRTRLMLSLLGKPLVDWITVKKVEIVPGAFVITLQPMPAIAKRIKKSFG